MSLIFLGGNMLAIGIMTGTSLDGIDIAYCGVVDENNVELLNFNTYDYTSSLVNDIKQVLKNPVMHIKEYLELEVAYSKEIAKNINFFLQEGHKVDFIAIHGQTLWHQTKAMGTPFTLQMLNPHIIAAETGIKVVSNFREKDIAVGGEGAPLVPVYDYLLHTSKERHRVLVNIGGISNLTYLEKSGSRDSVIAFDCGPGNMMINYAMEKFYNEKYDDGGQIASSGHVIQEMYDELVNHPYILEAIPKSTGRETFGDLYTEELMKKYVAHKKEDIIHTFSLFTAYVIYESICALKSVDEVFISGGGVHNQFIMTKLNEFSNNKYDVLKYDEIGNSDAKEAVAFALLGYLRLKKLPGNIKSATGATKDVILGSVTLPD
jgi:anhydro-N-acetylmuramic acid kinase